MSSTDKNKGLLYLLKAESTRPKGVLVEIKIFSREKRTPLSCQEIARQALKKSEFETIKRLSGTRLMDELDENGNWLF